MKSTKVFFIVLISVLSLASCTNMEEEIIGTWNAQTFDSQPQGTITWTFKDNGEIIRVLTNNDGITFDTCNYVIDKSLFKKQLTITGSQMIPGQDHLNGVYRIDQLKEDVLVMTRIRMPDDETAGAYLRCEMIRKQ
jgi:cobalamin biosynthesis Co2+ chelatase CbiK